MVDEDELSMVFSDFARTVVQDLPVHQTVDELVHRIPRVLPVSSAGVTLISDSRKPRYVAVSSDAARRFEKLQSDLGEGPCLAAFGANEAVLIPDLSAETRFATFAPAALAAGLRAVFTFPLRQGGGCLGALDLYNETTGALDARDITAAQTLADVSAAYVLNSRSRDRARRELRRFQHDVQHDLLTGLPNRLFLQGLLDSAGQRARRSRASAALVFVEVDGFRAINDAYGRATGDQLLVAVAERLTSLRGPSDSLARVGGNEFVYLCEDLVGTAGVGSLRTGIRTALLPPFTLEGAELQVTATVHAINALGSNYALGYYYGRE